jgi:polyhydroxyalkanoate synthesis regulator phasin
MPDHADPESIRKMADIWQDRGLFWVAGMARLWAGEIETLRRHLAEVQDQLTDAIASQNPNK